LQNLVYFGNNRFHIIDDLRIVGTGLLVAIEVLATEFGGFLGLGGRGDWGKVPATIPVMIFSLVYHDLAPGTCAIL
jgi:hypothetical protein